LVKINVVPSGTENQYFMLEDPIPSGCEVIQDEWAYPIENEPNYDGIYSGKWRWWYNEKEIRDNRVVFFTNSMPRNTYTFSYLLRAEIPGTFNVMPSSGMLMYYPDINGSGKELKVKIGE
jgi:alpha-2-macroglobulin